MVFYHELGVYIRRIKQEIFTVLEVERAELLRQRLHRLGREVRHREYVIRGERTHDPAAIGAHLLGILVVLATDDFHDVLLNFLVILLTIRALAINIENVR